MELVVCKPVSSVSIQKQRSYLGAIYAALSFMCSAFPKEKFYFFGFIPVSGLLLVSGIFSFDLLCLVFYKVCVSFPSRIKTMLMIRV